MSSNEGSNSQDRSKLLATTGIRPLTAAYQASTLTNQVCNINLIGAPSYTSDQNKLLLNQCISMSGLASLYPGNHMNTAVVAPHCIIIITSWCDLLLALQQKKKLMLVCSFGHGQLFTPISMVAYKLICRTSFLYCSKYYCSSPCISFIHKFCTVYISGGTQQ